MQQCMSLQKAFKAFLLQNCMDWPNISVVICTYNGKHLVKRLLDSILHQDYPQQKLEIICVDGGSADGTLELLTKYPVRVHHNLKKFPEGKGMGKDQGVALATGKFILIVDQDNKFMGSHSFQFLVQPLLENHQIFGVACKLFVDKKDSITNQYLSFVGTDPFAANRSLEGRMALGNIQLQDEGNYYTYELTPEEQLCTGGNCFLYRASFLREIGGYSQDVDVIAALVAKHHTLLAIPKHVFTHHLAIKDFREFLQKKWKWGYHYAFENKHNRDVSWYPRGLKDMFIFGAYLLQNFLILPGLLMGIKQAIKHKNLSWLLHPVALFANTVIYSAIGTMKLLKS